MEEIKGIILNGTQYGLEDETTLETANAGLKLAESNANDITALESDVIGVKTSAETALNTANSAKTTAESALTTAENAKALVNEKQPKIFGRYRSVKVPASGSYFFTDKELLEVFGKTNEELQGKFDFLMLLSTQTSTGNPEPRIVHMGSDGKYLYQVPYYIPTLGLIRENGKLGLRSTATESMDVWITAIPCELSEL